MDAAQYGEGVLIKNGQVAGHDNTVLPPLSLMKTISARPSRASQKRLPSS
jgi:hypothetical protein